MKTRTIMALCITILLIVVVPLVIWSTWDQSPELPVVNGQANGNKDIFINTNTIVIFSKNNIRFPVVDSGYGWVSIPNSDAWNGRTSLGEFNWALKYNDGGFILYAWE